MSNNTAKPTAPKGSSPSAAPVAAPSTKNDANAKPAAATATVSPSTGAPAPVVAASQAATKGAVPKSTDSTSDIHPDKTHPHPHVHPHSAAVEVHEHASAPAHAHSAVPSAHPAAAADEKKATAHHSAAGDHDAHHPGKPAIHPTAPIASTADAAHSSAAASVAAVGAAAAIPQSKHHYTLKEELSGSLWTLTTSKSWKLVCEEFPLQVTAHKFSIVGKHDLHDSLTKKGLQFHDQAMIFELCNPQIAANVLADHLALSAVLPCRMSVTAKYGEEGCAINLFLPNALLSACFPQQQEAGSSEPSKKLYKFQDLAENVTSTLKEIAKKAASK